VTAGIAGVAAAAGFLAYEAVQDPRSDFFGKTFTGIEPGLGVVALTFDDGPNGNDTESVLDVLKEENVHATFFVVGKAAARHPRILQRMVREGHAVGNHSWSHAHLNVRTRAGIRRELERAERAILAATGERTRLARPPFGARNFTVLDELRRLGYTCVLWSVPLVHEWRKTSSAAIAGRLLEQTVDGAILALHDGSRGKPAVRAHIAPATRDVITGCRKRGLRFVTIAEMLALSAASGAQ
jgi:peptidoglycan/xylan/chitin deacetylase (PgdA/CDA1 family)